MCVFWAHSNLVGKLELIHVIQHCEFSIQVLEEKFTSFNLSMATLRISFIKQCGTLKMEVSIVEENVGDEHLLLTNDTTLQF